MKLFTSKNDFMDYVDYLKEIYGTIELHPQHDTSIFARSPNTDKGVLAIYMEERLYKKLIKTTRISNGK